MRDPTLIEVPGPRSLVRYWPTSATVFAQVLSEHQANYQVTWHRSDGSRPAQACFLVSANRETHGHLQLDCLVSELGSFEEGPGEDYQPGEYFTPGQWPNGWAK